MSRPPAIRLHEAAWPDMLANLQAAYTELAQAQFELERRTLEIEETRDLFDRVIASMSEALFLVEGTGRVSRTNPAAGALLDCEEAELHGAPLAHLFPSDRIPATPWQLLARSGGQPQVELEAEVVTRRGRPLTVSVSCGLVRDTQGKIIGLLVVARDITDRRRAEHERAELLAKEQAAREEAEAANRAKDEFLATVSHELRTPLNAILGWARMLRAAALDPGETAHALETIERNARLQAQLIEDLLDVSRIVMGKLNLDLRAVDLAAIVEAALDVVRPAADSRSIDLEAVLHRDAGPVAGDADRLQQVVWNLLSNAVKFTPPGGRVTVRLDRTATHARVAVTDTGIGIEPEFLPHVFDRFRQADSTTTRRHGGLGLGLAIVRHLAELHGGSVTADSSGPEKGATFIVSLPLITLAPGRGDGPAAALPAPSGAPRLAGVRVLIVDDDLDQRDLLQAALRAQGAEVTSAGSVGEATMLLDRVDPDVVVSDIEIPDEDGDALVRRLRAREREGHRRVGALAVTAYAATEDRRRALAAGFDAHTSKPLDPLGLAATVAALAGRDAAGPP